MMLKILPVLIGLLCFISAPAVAGISAKPENEKDRVSYSVGYQVGGDFKRQGMEINPEAMVRGVEDALKGAEPAISEEEMHKTLVEVKKKIMEAQQAKRQEEAKKTLTEGQAFLAKNAKRKGVTKLPSGLQYEVLKKGEGAKPQAGDTVTVNYRGTLIDGTEFDSSYKRDKPLTFNLDRVIKGWTEGLQLMSPGAKYKLYIPAELAYGERGAGEKVPPNSTLIFEVELLSIGK